MIHYRKDLLLYQCTRDLFPLHHILLEQDYPPGQDVSMPIGDTATHLSDLVEAARTNLHLCKRTMAR